MSGPRPTQTSLRSETPASFALSADPLQPERLKQTLLNQHAGALATFEGWVRNHNEGKPVDRLEYSSYPELANKEGAKIVQEAQERFAIDGAIALHRTGLLEIGHIAVWVGACAAHRDAAFDACRYIIEEVKRRVPIWKKEYYSDGVSAWVNCHQEAK
ncbi:molybdenum cofactor biosynthesis protein MoaE [Pelagicoccus sp. SDUM812003]|uniref:molybdenum cofactor biosynthesis protein MoaE n=1 Tax=Pelagicoccus sp. SDUM812003 TaxID=3041267 RepID=UPI00280E0B88|nr:molybdenum cofactor biosynthesis protein MoaE [Pelagicoccus sp. SDUM812003]MDQ8202308.1 molybdenum cofactor biosynthesis protein MoaE [Pelagicoccus sp. SDUM812003]